jgi:hypothetical protein
MSQEKLNLLKLATSAVTESALARRSANFPVCARDDHRDLGMLQNPVSLLLDLRFMVNQLKTEQEIALEINGGLDARVE